MRKVYAVLLIAALALAGAPDISAESTLAPPSLFARKQQSSVSKQEQDEVRDQVFRHLDGVIIGPTIKRLADKGVLQLLFKSPTGTTDVEDIIKTFKARRNKGYIHGALLLLADAGWLALHRGPDMEIREVSLTEKGKAAFEFASVLNTASAFVPMALKLETYFFPEEATPPSNRLVAFLLSTFYKFMPGQFTSTEVLREYQKLVALSKRNWDLKEEADPIRQEVRQQIIHYANGLVVSPTVVSLAWKQKIFDRFNPKSNFSADLKDLPGDQNFLEAAFDLLASQGWAQRKGDRVMLTSRGVEMARIAASDGVTVSYLQTMNLLGQLLFGNPNPPRRTKAGLEILVNRDMNVWGSDGAHKTYFKAVDKIYDDIFNRPLDQQPRGLGDMGCGKGGFLKHSYEYIRDHTLRGKHLKEYPLTLLGADFNPVAQVRTLETLQEVEEAEKKKRQQEEGEAWVGFEPFVIFGDINNPDQFALDLRGLRDKKGRPIELQELLSIRSFLDHNRPFVPLEKKHGLRKAVSTGVFVHRGKLIPNAELEENLREHLKNWAPYVSKFGLLLIELYTLPPEVVSKNPGKVAMTAYRGTHIFSDQYLVEYGVFKEAAAEAGLVPDERLQVVYPSRQLPVVGVTYFTGSPVPESPKSVADQRPSPSALPPVLPVPRDVSVPEIGALLAQP